MPHPSSPPLAGLLETLRARGARIRCIRLKRNRSRLLSISRDGQTLHLHACFADAPPAILEAVAAFVTAGRRAGAARREAARRLRDWEGSREGIRRARAASPARPPAAGRGLHPARCDGTAAQRRSLAELYAELNRARFGGRLPAPPPVRVSRRMTRRLGHVRCAHAPAGERIVVEIAISMDLLHPGNGAQLRDTMLHEMAHVEAWITHGHAGHGPVWRGIARRVGCEARACTRSPVHRLRR